MNGYHLLCLGSCVGAGKTSERKNIYCMNHLISYEEFTTEKITTTTYDHSYLTQICKRINQIREKKGLSIKDLAYDANLERQSLSRLLTGKLNFSILMLKRIADTLGCEVGDFLTSNKSGDILSS